MQILRRTFSQTIAVLGFLALVSPLAGAEDPGKSYDLYKDPNCGCCGEWVDHMTDHGFAASVHHPADMNLIKEKQGIAPKYQSCHTAVTEGGYFFEGHVPARYIERFLAEKPEDAVGLAVPGMPLGSPGMEMGGRFTPYQVLMIMEDGSHQIYAEVTSPEQQ